MTLFRCMTGENWYDIMFSVGREKTEDFDCIYDPSYDDYVNNGKNSVGCGSSK